MIAACAGGEFTAKGKTVKHPGWKALEDAYRAKMKDAEPKKDGAEKALPELTEGQTLAVAAAIVKEGNCSCSGKTVIRETASWEGRSCTVFLLFFRSRKPADTSFSKIPARVAGVPRPFRSASSGISSFPAVSIADNRVSSESFCKGGAWIFFILLTQILSLLLSE